jgi:hypothetical protein
MTIEKDQEQPPMTKDVATDRRRRWLIPGAALIAGGLALGACATAERDRAMSIEPLLVAAGFQKRVADTPEKLAHLRQLEPLKLVPHARKTSVYYVYADPNGCRCAYVGNEMAFEQYQGLVLKQNISETKVSVTEADESSMMGWGSWGTSFWPQ